MNLFIFVGGKKKKKRVVKHPVMTANHKEQTSQVNDFNLMILVLFHIWQDAGIQESLNFLLLYGSYLGAGISKPRMLPVLLHHEFPSGHSVG